MRIPAGHTRDDWLGRKSKTPETRTARPIGKPEKAPGLTVFGLPLICSGEHEAQRDQRWRIWRVGGGRSWPGRRRAD